MTDFFSVFLRLTPVQFPESEFRLVATRLLFSIHSFSNLPFLDSCWLKSILSFFSFALKSPAMSTSLLSGWFDCWGLCTFHWPLQFLHFLVGHRRLRLLCIFGLHSILIHMISSCSCSSPLASSVVLCAFFRLGFLFLLLSCSILVYLSIWASIH